MPEMTEGARQTRLAQLQELYEEGLLDEATYRAKLEELGVDPDTVLAPPQPPDLATLRERLNRLDEAQIAELALDHVSEQLY